MKLIPKDVILAMGGVNNNFDFFHETTEHEPTLRLPSRRASPLRHYSRFLDFVNE